MRGSVGIMLLAGVSVAGVAALWLPPVTAPVAATSAAPGLARGTYLPDAGRKFPTRVLWGDEHLHTGWSGDASLGGTTLTPEDAVRFARGETVKSSSGEDARLDVPLDWLAVTDHSDGYGTASELRAGNPEMLADPTAKRWAAMTAAGGAQARAAQLEAIKAQADGTLPKIMMDPKWMKQAWAKSIAIMDRYNEPGRFTALIGYEWTSNAENGDNLHRNLIFRDGADKAGQVRPLTTFETENPSGLWKWMAGYEEKTGGQILAIPHNGNLSNGRMFEDQQYRGQPITREWAEMRARWEPLYEYYQFKGASEAHPSLSPTDEFANFEIWDTANLTGKTKQPGMVAGEYARAGLERGLVIGARVGANPFKFGAAGGTDSHTALSTAVESNYWAKGAPAADTWNAVHRKEDSGYVRRTWTQAAQGVTGVWASANTREAIWDAMKRKETYASSGPRITLRFFGGYGFAAADARADRLVAAGYAKGVPMGGDLKAVAGAVPTFLVAAMKDPRGANLDRVQIVKGWLDADGKPREAIFDVVWSSPAKRRPVAGKLPPVGDTVDVANASYRNTIGASELVGSFRDPGFDPRQPAFYYARAIEIPTPRWTAYDAKRFKVKMAPEVTMKLQERAVSSPIWYAPA